MAEGTATCIDILLAIILPPLGVFLKYGCHVEFWICLVLTLFGYLPGIIYAVYAITKAHMVYALAMSRNHSQCKT
ncbi:hypothetical protein Ahy_B06g080871 [Arachis hypogaea]|uniref:Hydrophobic protein n=2 Tax=Arachis TaxID=3817 RepID=A0A444YJD7_ARAHY|nr:hypothetical protein Ahy_B06g080871 [Arachis hypogaea]